MSYTDYLATRGYQRITVERTRKAPGDIVLCRQSVERVSDTEDTVVEMRDARGRFARRVRV